MPRLHHRRRAVPRPGLRGHRAGLRPGCLCPDHVPPDPALPKTLFSLCDTVRSHQADWASASTATATASPSSIRPDSDLPTDRVMMLLAADILVRQPGSDIVFDVACSKHLAAEIVRNGGHPVMWKADPVLIRRNSSRSMRPWRALQWPHHVPGPLAAAR
jgi:phosphomannomutase